MARITKKFLLTTLDSAVRPVTKGASFLDGLITNGYMRYCAYTPSEEIARNGCEVVAKKLIDINFPVAAHVTPWRVISGKSKGQWKIRVHLDLTVQPSTTWSRE